MTEALELTGRERVLEIGTGSGYQAAVLSLLAREIYSIEFFRALADESANRLPGLGYANVRVRQDDGARGWPERAPFDRVLATAAAPSIPRAWLDQLEPSGILIAPVGDSVAQRLVRIRKDGGRIREEDLGWVSFVPLLSGSEPTHRT
jgi:protein-L-isoaspartate(D-aspartate) O-methyltransferase